MTDRIIDRILSDAEAPALLETLVTRLSLTDLQTLLLEVYRRKAEELTPRRLLDYYTNNRFVRMSPVDPEERLRFDRLAFSLLPPGFEKVELSPVCPLGTVSALTPVDQNNVLTSIRAVEVCSDPTNVLALEAALRRRSALSKRRGFREPIRLSASQRVLRTQVFDEPAAYPHFILFCLCTAGRDEGGRKFETRALLEHLRYYLTLLRELKNKDFLLGVPKVVLLVLDEKFLDQVRSDVVDELSGNAPEIDSSVRFDPDSARGYYSSVRFQIFAEPPGGGDLLLVDGGFTDWTQKLLSDRKERLLTSGIGSERTITCFGERRGSP